MILSPPNTNAVASASSSSGVDSDATISPQSVPASAVATSAMSTRNLELQLMQHAGSTDITLPGPVVTQTLEAVGRHLEAATGDLMATLSGSTLVRAEQLQNDLTLIVNNGHTGAQITSPAGTPEHQLLIGIVRDLAQEQRTQGNVPLTTLERARVAIDHVGAFLSNDIDTNPGTIARLAGNVVSVGVRTGVIVALTTLLRQAVSFSLEKAYQQSGPVASVSPRFAAGVAAMLIGPGLNLAGAIRDEMNHTATTATRLSRVAMGLISIGALAAASGYQPPSVIGNLMGSYGPQMLTYTLARDLVQLFFPMHDNSGMNARGPGSAAVAYGVAQTGLGEAMDYGFPDSGAGYVTRVAANARNQPGSQTSAYPGAAESTDATSTVNRMAAWALGTNATSAPPADPAAAQERVNAALAHLNPNFANDVGRSLMNAATEVFDDLQRPALIRTFGVRDLVANTRASALRQGVDPEEAVRQLRPDQTEGLRVGMDRPRIGPGHWPTGTQIADQFLNTGAMRTSFLQNIMGVAMTTASAISNTSLSNDSQNHVVNAVVGAVVMLGYGPFIGVHLQRQPNAVRHMEDGLALPHIEMQPVATDGTPQPPQNALRFLNQAPPGPSPRRPSSYAISSASDGANQNQTTRQRL